MSRWPFLLTRRAADLPTPLADGFADSVRTRRKTVLFAEDDPQIGEMVRRLEDILSMEVTVVGTTAEARALIEKNDYDVAILDYHLLNGDSTPVYEQLVSLRHRTRVIFITGGSIDEVAERVHRIGPAPIYQKPGFFVLGFLVKVLGQLGIRPRMPYPA